MTAKARFTQADVTRTMRGVAAAKLRAEIVISPDGTIRIRPESEPSKPQPTTEPVASKREIVL